MKPKVVKYFTTFYTQQMIICSLVYIGINIKMYELLYDGTVLGIAITVLIQTMLLNSITGYLIFGIVRSSEVKQKVILYTALALANTLLILTAGADSLWAHIAAGCILAAVLGMITRHINGDNNSFETAGMMFEIHNIPEDKFTGINVEFPVDVGNKYKKTGKILHIGKKFDGKYSGKVVAEIKTDTGSYYICPIRQLKVLDNAQVAELDFYLFEQAVLYGDVETA